jgi:hypothetical protein
MGWIIVILGIVVLIYIFRKHDNERGTEVVQRHGGSKILFRDLINILTQGSDMFEYDEKDNWCRINVEDSKGALHVFTIRYLGFATEVTWKCYSAFFLAELPEKLFKIDNSKTNQTNAGRRIIQDIEVILNRDYKIL